jgi:hypothetical protein
VIPLLKKTCGGSSSRLMRKLRVSAKCTQPGLTGPPRWLHARREGGKEERKAVDRIGAVSSAPRRLYATPPIVMMPDD